MKTPIQTIMEQVEQEHLLEEALVRLNARVLGLAVAGLFASAMGLSTLVLLLKGGPRMGDHMNLLGNFFPFYRVSWPGLFLGVIYGLITGYLVGYGISRVYNFVAGGRVRGQRPTQG